MKLTDVTIFIIPIATGYIMSAACPMKKGEAGSSVSARPPGWVFGVVWPVLYLLMGLAWVQLRRQKSKNMVDALFAVLTVSLNSWIVVYSCQKKKKSALYVLLLSFAIAMATWGYSVGTDQMFYLTPLIVWLLFATMLNFTEVNTTKL
jgi:benzodiazapine receptor